MAKKLIQYGGYLLSVILIISLINPLIALNALEILLKITVFIFIPVSGINLLDKIIDLKYKKAWNYSVWIWLIMSIYLGYLAMKLVERLIQRLI